MHFISKRHPLKGNLRKSSPLPNYHPLLNQNYHLLSNTRRPESKDETIRGKPAEIVLGEYYRAFKEATGS